MRRALLALVLVALTAVVPAATSAAAPDFCERNPSHWKCAAPSPEPSVVPSPSPSASPSPSVAPSPTPEPSPSPSPTPEPVPGDGVWDIAFIGYRVTDATCEGIHVRGTIEQPEWDSFVRAQQAAVANIQSWNPGLNVRATLIERPLLTSVTPLGDGSCWPSPADVAPAGEFDSTFVFVEPTNDLDPTGPLPFWYKWGGLSFNCGTCYHGGGYSTGIARYSDDWQMRMVIHEWLHPTAAWFRERGAYVTDPHNLESTYPEFMPDIVFYEATISGTLPDRNGDGRGDGITDWHIQTAGDPIG